MKYGYARVSTPDQCLNLQLDALRLYGVDHICEEKISGKNKNKPVLDALIAKLKTGDQLIVWKLDRLGRRTCELIKLQEALEKKNIALISLTEQLNTSTPIGKFALLYCRNGAKYNFRAYNSRFDFSKGKRTNRRTQARSNRSS